ncbi:MAG: S1 RNA-binding domain-containing protein [Oscillospiraceae bacterium]|jgi:4-hydroxy-3-methylbut-2-enyl diphosphate reductase|nr:S1 RNA-binding domain-containing protein [Oscillospiraceae bacterium]
MDEKIILEEDSFSENFEEMLEESLKGLNVGKVVSGTVISVQPDEVYVDIGRKQSGIVPASELSINPDVNPEDIVKEGDVLKLFVLKTYDQDGIVLLSRKKISLNEQWSNFSECEKNAEILEGTAKKIVKGGMIISCRGMDVFIPLSQIGGKKGTPLENYLGHTHKLKIIEVDQSRKRIVGSIKLVEEGIKKEWLKEFWNNIEKDKPYQGIIKSITNYGVFVALGHIDGMIHISDLSWKRVNHPSDVVKLGDKIEVKIKSFNEEKQKVSLIYKKMEDNPWEILKKEYPVGKVFESKVINILPYGAFVAVLPGIDGLVHISEISNEKINSPNELLSVGDTVKVKIKFIDGKKVSLTMKDIYS